MRRRTRPSRRQPRARRLPLIIVILTVLAGVAVVLSFGLPISFSPDSALAPGSTPTPSPTPSATPTPGSATTPSATLDTPPVIVPPPADAPQQDRLSLVRLYTGMDIQPLTSETLYPNEAVGTTRQFWVLDVPGPPMSSIEAELRHVSEHALWYIGSDVSIRDGLLANVARNFDENIYEQTMQRFAPGAAPPGKLTIVNTRLGSPLAGYFTSADADPIEAYRFSNQRAVIFLNATSSFGSERYLGTVTHELQHFANWLVDPTEETWVNEGLSELAARSLGLPALSLSAYLHDPASSLTHWPEDVGQSIGNYAGSSLFSSYLAGRTGPENIHRLVAQSADGGAGIQAYLDEVAPGENFEELFTDWLVANLVGATEGRFAYSAPPGTVDVTRSLVGEGAVVGEVAQFGAWYLNIEPEAAPLRVTITGTARTPILPVRPHDDESCWWGNRGDNIDATLTRTVDLTGLENITLRFWTWYDIEEAFDHGYVAVSVDGGTSWTALAGELTTSSDPVGSALGPSYTGRSDGWERESIDLSPYVGAPVLLRFEYVTDESISNSGWCIDEINIGRVLLAVDHDESDDGWTANGFFRSPTEGITQQFGVRLVTGIGNNAQVTNVQLDERNRAEIVVDAPSVLVVTALSPKASLPARFRVAASPQP